MENIVKSGLPATLKEDAYAASLYGSGGMQTGSRRITASVTNSTFYKLKPSEEHKAEAAEQTPEKGAA